MRLRDGQIADYREVANTGPRFVDMNLRLSASSRSCAGKGMRSRPGPSSRGP
jgi:hypothetical protein